MARQLHRLFSSGSLYRSFIAQCRGLQNFTGGYLPYSSFQNGGNYRKWDHVRFGKVKETCSISKDQVRDQGFKIEFDFQFLRRLSDRYRLIAVTYKSQLSTGFPCPTKLRDVLTSGCVQNSVRLSSFSYQCIGRRCFSAKATEKSKVPSVPTNRNDNARDGRSGDNNGSFKVFHEYRGRAKSLAGHSSTVAGGPQVAVSRQVVQTTTSKTSKPIAKTLDVLKPKEQVGGGHKQDAQSELSILPVAKIDSDNQKRNAVKKKKQRSRNKKHVEKDTATSVISGATKAEEVSRKERSNFTKAIQSPQAPDLIPVCETSLQAVDCPALVHQQSKKAIDCSTRNRKPPKNGTVKKLSKGPLDKKRGVGGKSDPRGKTLKPLYPPIGKSVVVVESLAKAKIIQGYLGDMFEVLPSYGHVRDLAGRSGSVRPDDDFSMVWEVPSAAWTHLKSIKVALNGAKNLILASDPDREGEAVAWHIIEMLQQQDALHDNLTVGRVVYSEITEISIKSALQAPREINMDLVHAYLARRAIDYLIGFSISPLLWKKLPGCQSAGRVQSAALALICDRETEIDEFRQQEYWTVEADFNKKILGSLEQGFPFSSRLIHFDFKKLEKLSICSSTEAEDMHHKITSSSFEVVSSKRSKIRKNPPMPYITSTLQQDAANKMHFSPLFTMKLAQKLYEGVKLSDDKATGLITYMRTDGLHVSDAASEDIRSLVLERYGQGFAPKSARKYFKKVKNAQEAHEAIRPTDIRMLPSMLAEVLDEDSLKLYTLIWSRTMACQMEPAVIDQIQIDAGGAGKSMLLRSTWSRSEFLGYQASYKDAEVAAVEYNEEEGKACQQAFKFLCTLKSGDPLCLGKVEVKPLATQPPPRYTEGSLIKKLEELGIGRPSTYGTTIKILQDRSYVTIKNRVLYPEFRARMVSQYLSHHFSEVNDYSFTADMENELDNVSAGFTEWKGLMKDYWTRFNMYCSRAGNVDVRKVEKMLEDTFGHVLFSSLPDKCRTCPSCSTGTLIFKVSRLGSGYFIACDQHPRCKYIAKTMYGDDEEEDAPQRNELFAEPKVLGLHPASNEKIFLKNGPYGFYVQLGEDRKGYIPKRAAVSQIKNVESITLEDALDLLRYPITLGNHPDDGQPVYLKLARQGYTIRHRRTIAPVPKSMNPKSVTLEKAVKLLLSDKATRCGRPKNKPKSNEVYEAV